jgi:hypothetical protein
MRWLLHVIIEHPLQPYEVSRAGGSACCCVVVFAVALLPSSPASCVLQLVVLFFASCEVAGIPYEGCSSM